ncbi:hypothetical protein WMY93_013934 [Mugilogobius chulae]|uniref:Uncharacterized protein n=1 Tax=Mugilogobius chulae TaxID=88201 RepID=A0AAW0P1G7_9GOBI
MATYVFYGDLKLTLSLSAVSVLKTSLAASDHPDPKKLSRVSSRSRRSWLILAYISCSRVVCQPWQSQQRKRKCLTEDERKRKRELDRARARTRVNLGKAFEEWRELKEREGCRTDADVAMLLLDAMHSISIAEDEQLDSPDGGIDVDDFWAKSSYMGFEDGDSSDEDFIPSLHLRTVGVATEDLHEITVEESVLDFETPDAETPEEPEQVPSAQKVETVEDLIGKKANITYNDNLLSLATFLRLPIQKCNNVDNISGQLCPGAQPFQVVLKTRGTGVILEWFCPFGHLVWLWNSQPTLKFKMQGGDFMLSMNILLSGNNYRKIALLFKFMAMGMVAESTFFRLQDAYCIDPIGTYWEQTRAEVIERLSHEDGIVLLGHCAQFCTYTTIEQESRDIVHIESIDKRVVGRNSVIMEKECFCRTMDALLPQLRIKEVVTDAHPQISALLNPERGKYRGIQHSLDIWHAAKSLGKKLRKKARNGTGLPRRVTLRHDDQDDWVACS